MCITPGQIIIAESFGLPFDLPEKLNFFTGNEFIVL